MWAGCLLNHNVCILSLHLVNNEEKNEVSPTLPFSSYSPADPCNSSTSVINTQWQQHSSKSYLIAHWHHRQCCFQRRWKEKLGDFDQLLLWVCRKGKLVVVRELGLGPRVGVGVWAGVHWQQGKWDEKRQSCHWWVVFEQLSLHRGWRMTGRGWHQEGQAKRKQTNREVEECCFPFVLLFSSLHCHSILHFSTRLLCGVIIPRKKLFSLSAFPQHFIFSQETKPF